MREWKEFNVNNYVRVKPTPKGLATLNDSINKYYRPDAEGFLEMQMWCFMELFGPSTRIGSEPMFETTILIENKP